ncbi:hypothetical protein NHQ30_009173 [Ciborinia camelliae]|nr:hypothetical protein NHQ30_009173 [Ciborinia camelliae]
MERATTGESYDRLRGPRRAETLPVRFDENLTEIPDIGLLRRRGQEQRHVAGIPSPRGTIIDENDYHNFYDDQRTARLPRRTISPSPPPPEISQRRPRSPSAPSLASVERRGAHEFTNPSSYVRYQPTSEYNSRGPGVMKERAGDEYYLDRAAARGSTYYTRRTRSRSRRRSRSRSRSRYRYARSRSSSRGEGPNLNSYDVRNGGHGTRTGEIDFGLSLPESETYSFRLSRHNKVFMHSENTQDSNPGYSEKGIPPLIPQSHRSLTIQRPKVDRIIQSHYTGDGIMGGMHSVEFTLAPGQATSAGRLPVPLFNWV